MADRWSFPLALSDASNDHGGKPNRVSLLGESVGASATRVSPSRVSPNRMSPTMQDTFLVGHSPPVTPMERDSSAQSPSLHPSTHSFLLHQNKTNHQPISPLQPPLRRASPYFSFEPRASTTTTAAALASSPAMQFKFHRPTALSGPSTPNPPTPHLSPITTTTTTTYPVVAALVHSSKMSSSISSIPQSTPSESLHQIQQLLPSGQPRFRLHTIQPPSALDVIEQSISTTGTITTATTTTSNSATDHEIQPKKVSVLPNSSLTPLSDSSSDTIPSDPCISSRTDTLNTSIPGHATIESTPPSFVAVVTGTQEGVESLPSSSLYRTLGNAIPQSISTSSTPFTRPAAAPMKHLQISRFRAPATSLACPTTGTPTTKTTLSIIDGFAKPATPSIQRPNIGEAMHLDPKLAQVNSLSSSEKKMESSAALLDHRHSPQGGTRQPAPIFKKTIEPAGLVQCSPFQRQLRAGIGRQHPSIVQTDHHDDLNGGMPNPSQGVIDMTKSFGFRDTNSHNECNEIITLAQNMQRLYRALQYDMTAANADRDKAIRVASEQRTTLLKLSKEVAAVCAVSNYQQESIQFAQQRHEKMEKTIMMYRAAIHKLHDKENSLLLSTKEYIEKLAAHEKEMELFQSSKKQKQAELDEIRLKAEASTAALTLQINTLVSQREGLIADIQRANKGQADANDALTTAQQKFDKESTDFQDQLSRASTKASQATHDLESYKRMMDVQKANFDIECSQAKIALEEITLEMSSWRTKAVDTDTQCDVLRQTLLQLQHGLSEKQAEYDTTVTHLKSLQLKGETKVHDMQDLVDALNKDISMLKLDNDACVQTSTDLKKSILENSQISAQLEIITLEKNTLEQRLDELCNKLEAGQLLNDRLVAEIANLSSSNEANLVEELHKAKSTMEIENARVIHNMEMETDQRLSAYRDQICKLEHERDELNNSANEWQQSKKELTRLIHDNECNSISSNKLLEDQLQSERDKYVLAAKESSDKLDIMAAQLSIFEKECKELEERHIKDIQTKTAQWNSIVKRKEMEMQNALFQRDNHITKLKVQLETASAESTRTILQQIEKSNSTGTADDIICQLNLEELMLGVDTERVPHEVGVGKQSLSDVPSNTVALKPCAELCTSISGSNMVSKRGIYDQVYAENSERSAQRTHKQQKTTPAMGIRETHTSQRRTKGMKPPEHPVQHQSTSRTSQNTGSVSIVRETTTTVHRKHRISSSNVNVDGGWEPTKKGKLGKPTSGTKKQKLDTRSASFGRRQLALAAKPDGSVTSDATDLFRHAWEEP